MDRVPSGIPDKFFDLSTHFKVVDTNRPRKDEDLNETIQREGAQVWGPESELAWYLKHKGYSKKIEDKINNV
jgi:hypothetical protein